MLERNYLYVHYDNNDSNFLFMTIYPKRVGLPAGAHR